MSSIHVELPDGSVRELPENSSALDLAKSIGSRLAKAATGATINGNVVGLTTTLHEGDKVAILTFDSREGQDVFRHSAAHV
ncbi:MAG: TGS domain-containing protein, partial [FCB group bacterium]|nr:TGS domain-containing protein [FCB group bacterium]